jgi:hypothetical protein
MRAQFFRADAPDTVVGTATWDGRSARVEADDQEVRRLIQRVFRPAAVAVDDAASRPPGTTGLVVVEPGDLAWFRAAARVRGAEAGLGARLTTERPGGWDPALDSRTYGWGGSKSPVARER